MTLRWDWYLIEVWGGMMDTARCEIVAHGVDFERPDTWRREKLVSGQHAAVPYPRMPGNYAFVRMACDPSRYDYLREQAAALLSLRGVRHIFRSAGAGDRFAVVPRGEVQALRDADAADRKAAASARWKATEVRFKAETVVRIIRHASAEGHTGIFAYSVKGMATITMSNGAKLSLPECDLAEVTGEASRNVA